MDLFEIDGLCFVGNETEAEVAWWEETRAKIEFLQWCVDNLKQVHFISAA